MLPQLLKALAPDDVVAVTRIGRRARSTFDLLAAAKQIVDTGGQFRSLVWYFGTEILTDCGVRRSSCFGPPVSPDGPRGG